MENVRAILSTARRAHKLTTMSALALGLTLGSTRSSLADPQTAHQRQCTLLEIVAANALPYCVFLAIGVGEYRLRQRAFLATELLGSGIFALGFASPARNLRANSWQLGFQASLDGDAAPDSLRTNPDTGRYIAFTYLHSDASGASYFPVLDPGPGYGLGIPGIDGGASGIFLPLNPFNIVTDAEYRGAITWGQASFDTGTRRDRPGGSDGWSVGIRYSYLDQFETFGGQVPGYGGGFEYQFGAESQALGAHVGYHRSWALGGGDSAGWDSSVSLGGEAGLAYVRAEGDAWLGFSGGLNVVAPSYRMFDESGARPYASVNASVQSTHRSSGLTLSLGLSYDLRPWGVGFHGDGTNPFTMELQTMQAWNVFAGMAVRF